MPRRPSYAGLVKMVKMAKILPDGTFTLDSGQTLSHVVRDWNAGNPDSRITVQQVVDANGGLDPVKYRAGRQYRLPAMQPASVQQEATAAQAQVPQPPAANDGAPAATPGTPQPPAQAQQQQPQPAQQDHSAWTNWMWREQSHPARVFFNDLVRANANRVARKAGLPEDASMFKGDTITSMDNDKLNWLRMAIQAKGNGTAAPSGSFGGRRLAGGRTTDDYRTYVHPGFAYAGFPGTDTMAEDRRWWNPTTWRPFDMARSMYWRSTGVPNQIEHTLGDFSWSTDADGNIIVKDTYDFNNAEGRNGKTTYGGVRRFAGDWASKATDPDSQKTKFMVNLGNPSSWDAYDENKFRAFNEPYRERFPGMYHYSQQAPDASAQEPR